MDKVNLVCKINDDSVRELISIIIDDNHSILCEEKGKNMKFKKNINPFDIKDIKLMLTAPDLINTSRGHYKLVSNYAHNDDEIMANYLTYEKHEKGNFRITK